MTTPTLPNDRPLSTASSIAAPLQPVSESHPPPPQRADDEGHARAGSLSRPPSALSSQRGYWSQGRRSFHPPSSRSGPIWPPIVPSARPSSSSSKLSRTHVPSLTAQGFFRPMSSQRLQAQRSTKPNTMSQSVVDQDGENEVVHRANRESLQSLSTSRPTGPATVQESERSPPSRGTDYTEQQNATDRTTSNASPTNNGTVRSLGESVRLLQDRTNSKKPAHLDLSKVQKPTTSHPSPLPKSPRSLSTLLIPGRASANGLGSRDRAEHERLSSEASSPKSAVTKPYQQQPNASLGKNWEYFSGNTVFCLGGRLQNSRDRPINIATGILVVLPSVLFFAYSAPWLWMHVSPAIPILFAYLFLICISSFIHASVTDSGILPRNLHPMPTPDPTEDPLTLGPPMTEWTMVKLATSETAAMDVPTKYCKTCNIWRPPRCYHCRVCDNCVETQDHHCVWLNNCVGRRNYRYFFTFVSSATILGLFLLGASLGHILAYASKHNISFGDSIRHLQVPFAMFIYGILSSPYPASLWAYHLFLTGRGETTREYLNSHKFAKQDRHRPFTQGTVVRNWLAVLARPRPPTYLHFKKRYEEGDQRFGPKRGTRTAPPAPEQQGGGMEMHDVENP
ncbi:MAG: Eukaryotic peptide chain release factor GTP-binding subunit [Cirrosporium novae-zelandiae]|nr:MAG: Eukaryotic peptide chain release factor GTP-binding subunit [Cirrosporium novae-zelandiae]